MRDRIGARRRARRFRRSSSPISSRSAGRGSRADHGSARRPDSGLLRHPHRQPLRRAGVRARYPASLPGRRESWRSISPDVGGVVRARDLAKRIEAELAIVDKRRSRHGEVDEMTLIGDIDGRTCLIVDDICDTAGTLGKAADLLDRARRGGGPRLYQPRRVFSGPAIERIASSSLEIGCGDRFDRTDPSGRRRALRFASVSIAPL